MSGQNRKHFWNLYVAYHRKRHPIATLLKSFGRSHFHRLHFGHLNAGDISCPCHYQRSCQPKGGSHFDACFRKFNLALAKQIPATDTHYKHCTKYPTAQHGMEKLSHSHRRECHRCKIHHLITHCLRIECHAHRILHPSVGNQNPPCRKCCTDTCQPCRCQVETFTYFVPAKEHNGNERCLHKESQNTLDGQRSTENITYKPRVITPVRTELKLQNQSRSNTYGEVNTEKLHPELCRAFPEFLTCDYIESLHEPHNHSQS